MSGSPPLSSLLQHQQQQQQQRPDDKHRREDDDLRTDVGGTGGQKSGLSAVPGEHYQGRL